MSHAQHAISDLMLDLSSNSPRHLRCRPILIDHSAFLNTGMPTQGTDIFVAMSGPDIRMGPAAAGFQFTVPMNGDQPAPPPPPPPTQGQAQQPNQPQQPAGGEQPRPRFGTAPPRMTTQPPGAAGMMGPHHHVATIPILVQQTHNGMPTMEQLHQSAAAAAAAALNSNGIQELIQSIVSAAPVASIEVQRGNEPPITINVPPPPPPTGAEQQGETQSQSGANNGSTANGRGGTTATTMPTTSTQTRSTARPQMHVTSIQQPVEMRGPRSMTSGMFNAFDRFLPCNSHHVRENNRGAAGQGAAGAGGAPGVTVGGAGGENMMRMPHGRIQIPIGFPIQLRRRPGSTSDLGSRSSSRERPQSAGGSARGTSSERNSVSSDDLDLVYEMIDLDEETALRIRQILHDFVVERFFKDAQITTENINEAVNQILVHFDEFLGLLSEYEHPHISIRMSVVDLLRTHLREFLNLLRKDDDGDEAARAAEERFGSNLIRALRLLGSRLAGILLQSNRRRQDIRQTFRTIFNRHLKGRQRTSWIRCILFALKVCLQTLDTKFGASEINELTPFLVYKSPASGENSVSQIKNLVNYLTN